MSLRVGDINHISGSFFTKYIHLYSLYNMVAQANNTETSKNTTNKKEKK